MFYSLSRKRKLKEIYTAIFCDKMTLIVNHICSYGWIKSFKARAAHILTAHKLSDC
jgi:hypothetical protein